MDTFSKIQLAGKYQGIGESPRQSRCRRQGQILGRGDFPELLDDIETNARPTEPAEWLNGNGEISDTR